MSDRLSLHIDESGDQDLSEGLYLASVVLREHSADVSAPIEEYEKRLAAAGLPDVPFHGKDLLHGNEGYRAVSPGDRKRLLTQFARLVRSLPFSYVVLRYSASDTHDRRELESRIRRDFASLGTERSKPAMRALIALLPMRPSAAMQRPREWGISQTRATP